MEEYRHQVGGHCKLIKPKDSSKVYKPLIENEYIFYEKLKNFHSSSAESSPLQILKKFIPKFYGVVDIAVDSFSDLSSETLRKNSKMVEKSQKKNNMKYIRVNRNEKKKDYICPNANCGYTETEARCNDESICVNLKEEIHNIKSGEINDSNKCENEHIYINSYKKSNEYNSENDGDIANLKNEKKWIPHIILEDLVNGFKRPCVLDIKMGKRQRKIGASLEKKKRQVEKSFKTTSHSLGFRLCGCQHYNKLQDTLFYKDKYWGRSLSKENIPWAIRNWFWNGSLLYDELIPILLEKLHVFFNCIVELRHYRFWSSSLLWVFDGGLSDKKERSNSLDVRMIDFANTIYLQDNPSVDEEYIFGLRNLIYFIQILYNCIHNIYFLPYEINASFYSENYELTKKDNCIQPFYHNIVKGRIKSDIADQIKETKKKKKKIKIKKLKQKKKQIESMNIEFLKQKQNFENGNYGKLQNDTLLEDVSNVQKVNKYKDVCKTEKSEVDDNINQPNNLSNHKIKCSYFINNDKYSFLEGVLNRNSSKYVMNKNSYNTSNSAVYSASYISNNDRGKRDDKYQKLDDYQFIRILGNNENKKINKEKTNIEINIKSILNDNHIDTFDWKENKIIDVDAKNKEIIKILNTKINNYNENIKKEIIFDKLNEDKENQLKNDPKYTNNEQSKIESDSKVQIKRNINKFNLLQKSEHIDNPYNYEEVKSKKENNENNINRVMIQCLNDNKIYSKNLTVKKSCSKLSNLSIYENSKEKNINTLDFAYLSSLAKIPKICNTKVALKNINCISDSFLLFKKSLNLNSLKKIVKKKKFQMCEKSDSCTDVFISIKKDKKKKIYYEKKINMHILRKYNEFCDIKRFSKSKNQMNYLRSNNMPNSRHTSIYKKNKIYNKFYKINKNKKMYYSHYINKPLEEFNVYSEYKNTNIFFIDDAILNHSKKQNIFFNKHIEYELKRKNLIIPLTETNENYKYIRRSLSEPNIYKFTRFAYTSNNFNTTEIHYSNLIKNKLKKLIKVPIYGHIYGFISSSTNVDYFSNCSISE
ncbi:inositol polyphosphate kinase, putative [Plasmodium berghei]|uniref:Kinase n=1 Tax=Plasmodium berghei TaxID=5821 RepID=A0A113SYC2_PLABE|nr:inositol polyphosphate kinase, putative [Plasmodium berghei]SCO62514.1 inositol polyphosphate kinase, putative [Plasmodium berghei]